MIESIKIFQLINNNRNKYLILGNMNELGVSSLDHHIEIIKEIEKFF